MLERTPWGIAPTSMLQEEKKGEMQGRNMTIKAKGSSKRVSKRMAKGERSRPTPGNWGERERVRN